MKKYLSGAAALAFAAVATPLAAESLEDTAARYGVRPDVIGISLSPSGDKIAYISAGPGGAEILNVVDLKGDGSVKSILSVSEQNSDLDYCRWATEERLVCGISIVDDNGLQLIGFTRLLSVGTDGKDAVLLTPRQSFRALGIRQSGGSVVALDVPCKDDRILMTRDFVPETTIGTRMASSDEGLGVEEVDVTNGRRSIVERAVSDVVGFVADDTGRLRLRIRQPSGNTGMLRDKVIYEYRTADSDRWNRVSEVAVDAQSSEDGFIPAAIDTKRNVAFGYGDKDGFDAIYEMPLVEGGQPKLLLAKDGVDVDGLIRIGRQRRVVGATFAAEKREVEYFDAEMAKFAKDLRGALPGHPLIDIVGASADENKLLVLASSDTNPGMTYLYNKQTRELNELLPVRGLLANQPMGAMRPVTYPAADGTMIPGYLTLPPGSNGKDLPAIVMPHGGPSARDEWGFDYLVQFFVTRGYAVLQPNYRGSSGYGSAWFGKNGFKAWRTAIGDVNDAGKWLVSQGIAAPDKLAIVGWSYGGYAALQSQVADPSAFKAVVAIAPVTDLEALRDEARNYTSFSLVDKFIGHGEHVDSGSPARHADRFSAPVMLVHGTMDQNVGVGESRLMEKRLKDAGKKVEYIEYKGLDHSLSDSKARAEMLKRIDSFLASSLGK